MLYQIKVSEVSKSGKRVKADLRSKPIILRPSLSINDVAYWQERITQLLPECLVTCQVAK